MSVRKDVTAEPKAGVMRGSGQQAKFRWAVESAKGKKMDSSLRTSRRSQPAKILTKFDVICYSSNMKLL